MILVWPGGAGQRQADGLGYSPLPIELVQAGPGQINQVPGSTHKLGRTNLAGCDNPPLSPRPGGLLATNVPQSAPYDLQGRRNAPSAQVLRGRRPSLLPTRASADLLAAADNKTRTDTSFSTDAAGQGAFAHLRVAVSQTKDLIISRWRCPGPVVRPPC